MKLMKLKNKENARKTNIKLRNTTDELYIILKELYI